VDSALANLKVTHEIAPGRRWTGEGTERGVSMRHWMKARAARALAMLFGLSLVLTACNVNSVRELLADVFPAESGDAASEHFALADDVPEQASEDADAGDATADDEADDDAPSFNSTEHPANLRDEVTPSHRARKRTVQRPERERPDQETAEPAEDDDESEEPARQRSERRETAPPEEREAPPSGGQSGGLSSVEQQVFDLLNAERRSAGLDPLQLDSTLTEGARAWSRRMATEDFFAHDTSGNFAENIAYGYPTAQAVHEGWMDSEGHRNNRMNGRYTRYGVGVFEQGGTLYYTERFN
jgi:uncharacterized protein YkwD